MSDPKTPQEVYQDIDAIFGMYDEGTLPKSCVTITVDGKTYIVKDEQQRDISAGTRSFTTTVFITEDGKMFDQSAVDKVDRSQIRAEVEALANADDSLADIVDYDDVDDDVDDDSAPQHNKRSQYEIERIFTKGETYHVCQHYLPTLPDFTAIYKGRDTTGTWLIFIDEDDDKRIYIVDASQMIDALKYGEITIIEGKGEIAQFIAENGIEN